VIGAAAYQWLIYPFLPARLRVLTTTDAGADTRNV